MALPLSCWPGECLQGGIVTACIVMAYVVMALLCYQFVDQCLQGAGAALHSYGLYSYGLYSRGCATKHCTVSVTAACLRHVSYVMHWPMPTEVRGSTRKRHNYIVMAYIVMAYIVMADANRGQGLHEEAP